MTKFKSEKTRDIVSRLDSLQRKGDETLQKVAEVIREKVVFYDTCLKAWDEPSEKFSPEDVKIGRECCHAGINMADSIVNELRILFLKEE